MRPATRKGQADDALGALSFQGQPIQARDDQLNLTDMWRAAGSDPQKQPAKWRELPQATDFISYISHNLGKSESILVLTKPGKGGGTWAHWQIGLVYAKYLSNPFHEWCNNVVRKRMEGRGGTDFEQKVMKQFDKLTNHVERIDLRIDLLEKKLLRKRRDITEATRTRLIAAVMALGHRCPCCGLVDVLTENGDVIDAEFDHYYSNQLPTGEHAWLICKPCHRALTDGTLARIDADAHFRSFQLRFEEISKAHVGEEVGAATG